jgi:hypothetical protein
MVTFLVFSAILSISHKSEYPRQTFDSKPLFPFTIVLDLKNCLERNISETIARNGGQKDESRKKNEYECHQCKKYVTLKSSLSLHQ